VAFDLTRAEIKETLPIPSRSNSLSKFTNNNYKFVLPVVNDIPFRIAANSFGLFRYFQSVSGAIQCLSRSMVSSFWEGTGRSHKLTTNAFQPWYQDHENLSYRVETDLLRHLTLATWWSWLLVISIVFLGLYEEGSEYGRI